jgi:hypothetical protein
MEVAGEMLKKCACTALLVFLGTRDSNASSVDKLRKMIERHEWESGVEICEGLPKSEGHRPDRQQVLPPYYAQLSVLCAALASGAGNSSLADWWWFTARAMDVNAATQLLGELQGSGLRMDLAAPRQPVNSASQAFSGLKPTEVRLLNGEIVEGRAPKGEQTDILSGMFPPIGKAVRFKIAIEVVVGVDGTLRQPVVLVSQAPPLYGFQALCSVRHVRVKPAVIGERAVESVYVINFVG